MICLVLESAEAGLQKDICRSSIAAVSLFRNQQYPYTALSALGSRVFRRISYHLNTSTCVCVQYRLDENSDYLLPSRLLTIFHALHILIWHILVSLSHAKLP